VRREVNRWRNREVLTLKSTGEILRLRNEGERIGLPEIRLSLVVEGHEERIIII
jgi:hypothetical protein